MTSPSPISTETEIATAVLARFAKPGRAEYDGEYAAIEIIRAWKQLSETMLRRAQVLSDMQDEQIAYLIDAISDHAPCIRQWEEKIAMERNGL